MVLLLDCLKRRENWAEEFITALENCGHATMAAEIADEYNALKGSKSDGICSSKRGFQWPPGFTGLNQARPPEAVVTDYNVLLSALTQIPTPALLQPLSQGHPSIQHLLPVMCPSLLVLCQLRPQLRHGPQPLCRSLSSHSLLGPQPYLILPHLKCRRVRQHSLWKTLKQMMVL